MFDSLEDRLSTLSLKVHKKIEALSSTALSVDEKVVQLPLVEDGLKKLQGLLRQMEVETRTESEMSFGLNDMTESQTSTSLSMQRSKLQLETGKLVAMKEKYEALKGKIERFKLLGERGGDDETSQRFVEERGDVEHGIHERLLNQNETLARARDKMDQTEHLAMGVTENLAMNREKMSSARKKAQGTTGTLYQSQDLLNKMLLRENRRKYAIRGVMLFLGLLFGVFLFQLIF